MNDSGGLESHEGELDPDLTEDWSETYADYIDEPAESHWINRLLSGFLLLVILFPIMYFLFR